MYQITEREPGDAGCRNSGCRRVSAKAFERATDTSVRDKGTAAGRELHATTVSHGGMGVYD
jgi:hypothetical protein